MRDARIAKAKRLRAAIRAQAKRIEHEKQSKTEEKRRAKEELEIERENHKKAKLAEKAENAREFALFHVHLWPKIIDVQTIRRLCEHICNAGADSYAHACPVIGDHSLTRSLR